MVGQHRDEQVCTDSGIGVMPDRAHAEFGLQLPEGIFNVGQPPVSAETLFRFPVGVACSEQTGPGNRIRHLGFVSCRLKRTAVAVSPVLSMVILY